MKTWQETVTRREGENLGPIDFSYDWKQYGTYPNNPEYAAQKIELIREIELAFRAGKLLHIQYSGGFEGDLLDVGMYDGWPFWKPTPAVLLRHWHGEEWHFWYEITGYTEAMK